MLILTLRKQPVVGHKYRGYLQEQNGMAVSGQDMFWNYAFDTPPFYHPIQYSGGRDVRVTERHNPLGGNHTAWLSDNNQLKSRILIFYRTRPGKFITPRF